jgi:hypothetical protein
VKRGSARLFAAGAAGIAGLLFVYYAAVWHSLAGFFDALDACPKPFCDFVNHYFPMGEAILRTGLPAPGFFYSPFIALLLALLPPLGFGPALFLWGALELLFLVLYLALFRRLVPAGLGVQLLFVALALSSQPVLHDLKWGQVSLFILVPLLALLAQQERGRRAIAGALLAFAASFKFLPLLFVTPFALRRDLRFLLFTAAGCVTLLLLIPGLLLGFGETIGFYRALRESFAQSGWVVTNINSQHFPHVVLRLADLAGHDARADLPMLRAAGYLAAAVNLALLFLVERARLRYAGLWSFQILFLTTPFVLKTSWPHDFVFLPFIQTFLAWRLLQSEEAAPAGAAGEKRGDAPRGSGLSVAREGVPAGGWRGRLRPGRVALALLLLLPSVVVSNIVFFNLFGDRWHYGFYGFLFFADLLLLIALYVVLLPAALRGLRNRAAAPLPA